MAGVVIIFDFDKTIMDCECDDWIVEQFGLTELFNHLLPTMPWNSLMDLIMKEIHSQGKTTEDIVEVLKRTPIHPRIVPAIKTAHSLGCELRILSDANVFYIETILKHLGLRYCFSEITTNPAFVDKHGRLRIFPYHDFHKSSHECSLCPPNMCKGVIIEKIQASILAEGKKKLIYIGDGIGDYCPILRLKEFYFVMPRKKFPLWDLIYKDPLLIKAEINEWSDGKELEKVLISLINKISIISQENALFISTSTDCKLQTVSVSAHEAIPQALPLKLKF